MEQKKNLQVFISFCGADEDKKNALESALQPMIEEYKEQGVEINVADMAKMDQSHWDKWMIQTVKSSDIVLAILSNATMYPESGVPKRALEELCEARNNGIEILPVIFDRPISDEFRAHINRISQIWRTYDGAVDNVYEEAAKKAGFLIKGILDGKKSQTYESIKINGGKFLSNPNFVGRERELQKLSEAFKKTNVVILTGEGGIGKTSLAQQFFYENKHVYDRAYIINASSGVRQAITDMIFENAEPARSELERYQENCRKLSLLDEKAIIIFDNCDQEIARADLAEIVGMHCRFLITSRVSCKQYPAVVQIGKMAEKDLLALVYKHHPEIEKRNRKTSEEVVALLHEFFEAIDGHTMTVEMAAAIMRDGRKKIEEINEAIFTCNRVIGTDHSHERKITAFEHLSTLYDLASISKDEEKILSAACLIAPQVGVDCEELQELLQIDDDYEAMDHLVALTFLRQDENDCISMHPLFSDVFYKKANVAEKAEENETVIRYLMEKGERIDVLNMDVVEAYEGLMEYLLEKRETAFSNIEYGEFLYHDVLFSMSDCLDALNDVFYKEICGKEETELRNNPYVKSPIHFRLWLCYQKIRYGKVLIRFGEAKGMNMEANKEAVAELQRVSAELKQYLDENPELS